ncbi:glutathione S-transferase [Canna indica]|uniref:Probable glutathione S-transferase GSTU1 n=1 Tax=Canna indica TaxID=4628 RepID=A0AAQ3PZF2_9LILI|nr:glutathione S-transferase [Canna indica]
MGVDLLSCWFSPYGMRVQVALAEKGVGYEFKEENLLAGKSPLLLQSNPVHKKIPILLHDGKPVCESLVILSYIEEAWPETAPMLPPAADPLARAHARFWADFVDKKIMDGSVNIWKSNGEAAAEAAKAFIESLKVLEGELGEKKYFGGKVFGLVDITLAPLMAWYYAYEKYGGFSMEAEVPKLMAWGKRCLEKESVAKSLPEPEKVYGFVGQVRKMFGLE